MNMRHDIERWDYRVVRYDITVVGIIVWYSDGTWYYESINLLTIVADVKVGPT